MGTKQATRRATTLIDPFETGRVCLIDICDVRSQDAAQFLKTLSH